MTPRDPAAPEHVIDLDAHRRQRMETLSADALDPLLDAVTADKLTGAAYKLLASAVGALREKLEGSEHVAPQFTVIPSGEPGRVCVQIVAVLEVAGLNELAASPGGPALSEHATAVLAALDDGWLPVTPLAHRAGLDTADTRRALNELWARGLAQHVGDEWRRA